LSDTIRSRGAAVKPKHLIWGGICAGTQSRGLGVGRSASAGVFGWARAGDGGAAATPCAQPGCPPAPMAGAPGALRPLAAPPPRGPGAARPVLTPARRPGKLDRAGPVLHAPPSYTCTP